MNLKIWKQLEYVNKKNRKMFKYGNKNVKNIDFRRKYNKMCI